VQPEVSSLPEIQEATVSVLAIPPRALVATQRTAIFALVAPVLLLITIAAVPAFAVLPFVHGGTDRVVKLLRAHSAYARTLLTGSRNSASER
jgi:hypothetical protein